MNITDVDPLIVEVAGLINLLAQGFVPSNLATQAIALNDKLGDAIAAGKYRR